MYGVDRPPDVFACVVLNGKFYHPHRLEGVVVPWKCFLGRFPFSRFLFGSFAQGPVEFYEYVHNTYCAEVVVSAIGNWSCASLGGCTGSIWNDCHGIQNKIASFIQSSHKGSGECFESNCGCHLSKSTWLKQSQSIELRRDIIAPLLGYFSEVSTDARIRRFDRGVNLSDYTVVVPTGKRAFKNSYETCGNENYISVQCGDLTAVISWNATPSGWRFAAVSRHDNLVVCVVDNPDAPVLNLGRRWIDQTKDQQQKGERPHVVSRLFETLMIYGDGHGRQLMKTVNKAIGRAVIEVGFIVFLFYSNLLMGEFGRSGKGREMGLAWAIADILTPANFAIAITAALIGYVVFEFLRSKF